MKKLFYFILFLLPICSWAEDFTIEIRGASFYPTHKSTREVFSESWLDFETIASMNINDYFDVFAQACWSIKKGSYKDRYFGRKFEDHSTAWIVPVSLGVRGYFPLFKCLTVYGGIGANYSFLKLESHPDESFVGSNFKKSLSRGTFGGLAKFGFIVDIGDNVFIDVFADYIYQKFSIGKHRCFREFGNHFDASGFKFGGGLGVYF